MSNIQKNIFLNMKTSKIKSEKNIYQTIHSASFIFIFFGIFTIFLYFYRFFENSNSILWKKYTFTHSPPQTTRCNFLMVWQFSIHHRHVDRYGKLQNHSKIAPGGLWRRVCKSVFFFKKWNLNFQKKYWKLTNKK